MDEFLRKLRSALSGEIPEHEIEQNLNYYADYFIAQANNGKNEAQILEELGDPSLIARSIIDADRISGKASYNFNSSSGTDYERTDSNDYRNEEKYASNNYKNEYKNSRFSNWRSNINGWREREVYETGCCGGGCLKIGLIIFFILLLVVAIVSTIFKGLFSVFKFIIFGGAPVIIILLVVLLVILYRGRK